jgi:hypothetical protein
MADLEFGIGPAVGAVARYRNGTWPIAARANALFSYFSQTPTLGGASLGEKATLSHFGIEGGIEFPLGVPKASAPYLVATAGIFRFAGSGPAGDVGDIPDGVFTGTTDVTIGAGAGFRFFKRFFIEARAVTSGDFTLVPVTLGYSLRD